MCRFESDPGHHAALRVHGDADRLGATHEHSFRVRPTSSERGLPLGNGPIGSDAGLDSAIMLAFTFPGQGSQSVGMGRALAEASPEARAISAATVRPVMTAAVVEGE